MPTCGHRRAPKCAETVGGELLWQTQTSDESKSGTAITKSSTQSGHSFPPVRLILCVCPPDQSCRCLPLPPARVLGVLRSGAISALLLLHSFTFQGHMGTLWNRVLQDRAASSARIVFLGHSNGGRCIQELVQLEGDNVLKRTAAIALTDAIWSGKSWTGRPDVINWVASQQPVGSILSKSSSGDEQRSAGSTKHVYTTHSSREDFWPWLDSKVAQKGSKTSVLSDEL